MESQKKLFETEYHNAVDPQRQKTKLQRKRKREEEEDEEEV